jgi:hypothetical protein
MRINAAKAWNIYPIGSPDNIDVNAVCAKDDDHANQEDLLDTLLAALRMPGLAK